jgi:hypothetical protein
MKKSLINKDFQKTLFSITTIKIISAESPAESFSTFLKDKKKDKRWEMKLSLN